MQHGEATRHDKTGQGQGQERTGSVRGGARFRVRVRYTFVTVAVVVDPCTEIAADTQHDGGKIRLEMLSCLSCLVVV